MERHAGYLLGVSYLCAMKPLIAPSILSADFSRLGEEIEMLNQSEADWIHCDVMDGVFVPNISFGIPVLQAVKRYSRKPLDVHLMIVTPEKYTDVFQKAGADILTVHAEACTHLDRTLHAIRDAGMKAGVALNPSTPVEALLDVLAFTDVVCLMSVNPGFGGQKFIPNTFEKLRRLGALIRAKQSPARIEIDGGVDLKNAPLLAEAGADILVAGNTVFAAADPAGAISSLKNATLTPKV